MIASMELHVVVDQGSVRWGWLLAESADLASCHQPHLHHMVVVI